jgi:hypothetical protein
VEALGRLFDVIPAVTPVDLDSAGTNTGARLHLQNYGGVAIVFYRGQGVAAENPTLTVREHNANTGGTSADLEVVTHWFKKEAATLDGSETWEEVVESSATDDITDAEWDDGSESIAVIQVEASQLSDDFEWISANVDDPGTGEHLGAVFYIAYDLAVQRAPDNLADPNA